MLASYVEGSSCPADRLTINIHHRRMFVFSSDGGPGEMYRFAKAKVNKLESLRAPAFFGIVRHADLDWECKYEICITRLSKKKAQ
jgi:hypothetical protein